MEKKMEKSAFHCDPTPQKKVFSRLLPVQNECFLCGNKSKKHLRMMQNVALRSTYRHLLKQVLMIELPEDIDYKICEKCIHSLHQDCAWKKAALNRLNKLVDHTKKRSGSAAFTPSPSRKKVIQKPECTPSEDHVEHDYARIAPASQAKKVRRSLLHSDFEQGLDLSMVDPTMKGSVSVLIKKMMANSVVKEQIIAKLLSEMDESIDVLCSEGSVLVKDAVPVSTLVPLALAELQKRVPLLFDVLSTASWSERQNDKMFIGIVYGMLMRQRSQRLNAIQQAMTAMCIRYHAGNQMMNFLSKSSLSFGVSSKTFFLENISKKANDNLIHLLQSGRDVKVTVDNIDGRMIANQMRLCNGNTDYHYTHWSVLPDRFDASDVNHLSNSIPDHEDPPINSFFCSQAETKSLKYSYAIILVRILCKEFAHLKVLANCIPDVIPHNWEHITARKSEVFPQAIILEDSKYLPSCVRIMDAMSNGLHDIYSEAGRGDDYDAGKIKITVGGDQLTRCHLDSAKHLRMGTHTPLQRLEHLSPVLEEMFHVQQDLLEKIFNNFYDSDTARYPCTLPFIKARLQRSNVNGRVKSTNGYEWHRDFAVLVTRALIVEYVSTKLGLDTTDEPITSMPPHIKMWTSSKKLQWLVTSVQPFVEDLFLDIPLPKEDNIQLVITAGQDTIRLSIPPRMRGDFINVRLNNVIHRIQVPLEEPDFIDTDDDVVNYNMAFLRSMMDFLVLCDVISAGDIDRLPSILKKLIPQFVRLSSFRSKYAIECVNFVTKTECVLSPRESMKAKLRGFVNTAGKNGFNKPADMQQENSIKLVKGILRGLGASKTPAAMVRSSRAGPAVSQLAAQFQAGMGVKEQSGIFQHHKKDDTEDKELVLNSLREHKPFVSRQRVIPKKSNYSASMDKFKLCDFIKRNSKRALHHIVDFDDE